MPAQKHGGLKQKPPLIPTYRLLTNQTADSRHNKFDFKHDRQYTRNITLWRVRETIVTMEIKTMHYLCVVSLQVTVNNTKILTVAQQCFKAHLYGRQQYNRSICEVLDDALQQQYVHKTSLQPTQCTY